MNANTFEFMSIKFELDWGQLFIDPTYFINMTTTSDSLIKAFQFSKVHQKIWGNIVPIVNNVVLYT